MRWCVLVNLGIPVFQYVVDGDGLDGTHDCVTSTATSECHRRPRPDANDQMLKAPAATVGHSPSVSSSSLFRAETRNHAIL